MTIHLKKLVMVVVAVCLLSFSAGAQDREWAPWCTVDESLGWDFYCDPANAPEEQVVEAPAADEQVPPTPPDSALEELEALQLQVDEARAKAVLYPNEENVYAYLVLQKGLVSKAAFFADHWRRVVWQNPELDYEAEHPQVTLGKNAVKNELHYAQLDALGEISEDYALVYVGGGSCSVCNVYGPNLRDYANKYGFTVLAVSVDGLKLSGFERATREKGELERMGITEKRIPLTLLYHRKLDQVTVLGVGFLAQQSLTDRIYALIKQEVGDAY